MQAHQLTKSKKSISKILKPTSTQKLRTKNEENEIEEMQYAQLINLIEELTNKQKEYQKKGKYVEAQKYKREVAEYRINLNNMQIEQMKKRHHDEILEIQRAHNQEMNCFNIEWDTKINNYNVEIEKMEIQLAKRHQDEIKIIEKQMSEEHPVKFFESPQLLNLRKIQQLLANQENYMEAHQVQQRAMKLYKEQEERWSRNNTMKGKHNLTLLKTKHENEIAAIQQKIQGNIKQKQLQRKNQQEQLMKKYYNILQQIQSHHNQEIIKLQKQQNSNQKNRLSQLSSKK